MHRPFKNKIISVVIGLQIPTAASASFSYKMSYNNAVYCFATSAFAAILGHIGDDMVAANAVAVMVVNIGAIACRGFAKCYDYYYQPGVGKDQIDTAREYGKRMLRITIVVSLIGCVIILALRPDTGFLSGQIDRDCPFLS